MSTRLIIPTKGGTPSEGDTFSQLTEYLRLAEECCYTIGHLRKMNDDNESGQSFINIGQTFARTRELLTSLAIRRRQ